MSDSDLYDTDILLWSERQADLLRRHAAGERVNDASIDWSNIVEEIEDVGRSELRSCRSLLRQALRHMLKAEAWPLSRGAPTWRADAIDFRRQARDAFTPSMRQKIDVAGLYTDALAAMPDTIDGQATTGLQVCGGERESKKEAIEEMLRAAAAAPDLLAMRRQAMAAMFTG